MTADVSIRPLAGSLGAELFGIDLSGPLSDGDIDTIRSAWLDNLVLVFRDQTLEPQQFLDFARRLGEPGRYPFVPGLDEFPEIIEVKKLPEERNNFGGIWHTDTAYLERPPTASMLLARDVPAAGGDTEFANMYAAYESLSDGLKSVLSGLRGVNCSALADVSRTREDRTSKDGPAPIDYESIHPVVRTHPETGRKSLYVNIAHTARFDGWTEEESQPLLRHLFNHQVKSEFTCRLRWDVGTLAIWDNRCALHNPINDYHGHRRLMHRITLTGDVPA